MKKFKIQIPASKFYFYLFLFPNMDKMRKYLSEKEDHDPPNDFYGLVSRYFEGRKIAHLYFSSQEIDQLVIEHELIHILWQYMRHRYYTNNNYDPYADPYEEELAYLYNYLGVKVKHLVNFNDEGSLYQEWTNYARGVYNCNRKRYNWSDVKGKKKRRKVSA